MSRALFIIISGAILIGCGSSQTELTKVEQDNFKGAPMPDDARKKMNENIAAWREKNGQAGSPASSPNGSR